MSAALAGSSDDELASLLRAGRVGDGIGGTHAVLEVAGSTVFAKSVPLTEQERLAAPSTANLFGLPLSCQYGVASPGFNVWRELAAHEQTTRWVLEGDGISVPLLHHARVLASNRHAVPPVHEHDAIVDLHGGDRAVARRLAARADATSSLVLFLEHVPWNVEDWFARQLTRGDDAVEAAIELLRRSLPRALRAMNDRGLFHFDAHLRNVLTDGDAVYVADFGLATSPDFELTAAERRFVAEHRLYDPAYAITRVVNQVVTALSGVVDPSAPDPAARNAYIQRCAEGADATGLPPAAATLVTRFAPLAVLLNEFSWALFDGPPAPPFPREAVAAAAEATGLLG